MGGWRLEVFRMTGYVALPIICFYLFNKPEYFKDFLIKNKRFYFADEDQKSRDFLEHLKSSKEQENEMKILAEIEALKAKKASKN